MEEQWKSGTASGEEAGKIRLGRNLYLDDAGRGPQLIYPCIVGAPSKIQLMSGGLNCFLLYA